MAIFRPVKYWGEERGGMFRSTKKLWQYLDQLNDGHLNQLGHWQTFKLVMIVRVMFRTNKTLWVTFGIKL